MTNDTKIEPRLLKGFRDYDPLEQSARQNMFSSIQSTFDKFGFLPLSTPVLEYKEILMGKIGEDEKLIYSFRDNGDREVALRYDLTVPLARYVAQNQNELTLPFKRYQIAPVWRADKPQKGRYREFYQCDVDVVGTDSVLADAEVIACVCKAMESLGVSGYKLRINDRRLFSVFTNMLEGDKDQVREIIRAIDKVEKIGPDGVFSVLKDKKISDNAIAQVRQWLEAGTGLAALDIIVGLANYAQKTSIIEIKERVIKLLESLKAAGIADDNIIFDPSIARGLDYYTSTVFETILPDRPEFGSICSGGRYDNLVDKFSNISLPAVGASIGIDRLFEAMKEMNLVKSNAQARVLILNVDKSFQEQYVKLVTMLRNAGISAELYYGIGVKLEKQFKYAEAKGISYAVIFGQTEMDKSIVQLKNLTTRDQSELPIANLVEKLKMPLQ